MYLRRSGWTDADEFTILTKAGPITADDPLRARMHAGDGQREHRVARFPLRRRGRARRAGGGGRSWCFQHVSIGNPQCAIAVGEELESLDLPAIGPEIENSELFPNRTNVSFFRAEWRPGARPDLRARRGGDALLGNRRIGRGGGGSPGRCAEPR